MAHPSAQTWIKHLGLTAHMEGGWYKEVYRSPLIIDKKNLPDSFSDNKNASTHIYFLLEKEQFSAFHRIKSDELWHFYSGDPLIIYEIDNGTMIEHLLGSDPGMGQSLFCVIRAGNWFASKIVTDGEFGLVGCTVSPGFDFADFEMAAKENLLLLYPQHRALIGALCR
jgi:predicted cupin superfamily sugar epimerase